MSFVFSRSQVFLSRFSKIIVRPYKYENECVDCIVSAWFMYKAINPCTWNIFSICTAAKTSVRPPCSSLKNFQVPYSCLSFCLVTVITQIIRFTLKWLQIYFYKGFGVFDVHWESVWNSGWSPWSEDPLDLNKMCFTFVWII